MRDGASVTPWLNVIVFLISALSIVICGAGAWSNKSNCGDFGASGE